MKKSSRYYPVEHQGTEHSLISSITNDKGGTDHGYAESGYGHLHWLRFVR
jgi:hypothetical protein